MSIDRMGGERIINKGVLKKLIMASIARRKMVFVSNSRSY
jgi:hypothetical protein